MESVAPKHQDDDVTPPDGLHLVVDRVTRLEKRVGDFGEGLVQEVRTIAGAQVNTFEVLCAVRDDVAKLSAKDDTDETAFKLYHSDADDPDEDVRLYINGAEVAVVAASGGLALDQSRLRVGSRVDGTRLLSGDIAELLICYATSQQHDDLLDYFAARYPSLGIGA